MKGAVPGFDYIVGRLQPIRAGHFGRFGIEANERSVWIGGFGKEMIFAFNDQDHTIAIGIVEVLIDYEQCFRIAYRVSIEVRSSRRLLLSFESDT